MDRIKQALERARAEREGKPAAVQSVGQRRTASVHSDTQIRYTDTRVFTPPPTVLKNKHVIAGIGPGVVTDAYGLLRTRVLQRMRQNSWNSLAITSPNAGDGKSLTAVNLAVSLAREVNHSVLLVDLDLRRPNIHTYFGYQPAKGLTDYVLNDTPLSEILFNPSIERLVVLPNRKPITNSSEVLSSPRMIELVAELKSRYPERLVIFDLPPLLSADDALAFSPYVDAVLLVIEEGKTPREDVERAGELLAEVNVVGSVLNRAEQAGTAQYY